MRAQSCNDCCNTCRQAHALRNFGLHVVFKYLFPQYPVPSCRISSSLRTDKRKRGRSGRRWSESATHGMQEQSEIMAGCYICRPVQGPVERLRAMSIVQSALGRNSRSSKAVGIVTTHGLRTMMAGTMGCVLCQVPYHVSFQAAAAYNAELQKYNSFNKFLLGSRCKHRRGKECIYVHLSSHGS